MATVERRPIADIMYRPGEYDVLFLQPMLYQRWFAEEQNEVFLYHQRVTEGHSALMNDLGTEPNHGILQLAAILMRAGVTVDVLDFHVLDIVFRRDHRLVTEEDIRLVLSQKRAKVFGISSKIISAKRSFRLAEIVKELYPDSTVVIGGVHPTFQAVECLEECPAVDVVARGESDHAILDIWRWQQGEKALEEIEGITYRDENGRIISKEKRLEQIDLDTLPYPAYELVAREVDPLVPRILTARGCVLRCVFCASAAMFGYRFNSREAIRVADQIQYTAERFGLEFICMGDLTFMAHKETGRAICSELVRRDLDVKWSTQTTIGRVDESDAELMAKAGCVQIGFGVESGEQLLVDDANKRVAVARTREQFKIVKAAGISVQTYWVFGLPGESYDSAMMTIELMRELVREGLVDSCHITVATPYPGTPLYENPEAYGIRIVDRDFDNYMSNGGSLGIGRPVIETASLSRDHIYMFWQLAHATVAEEFARRFADTTSSEHYIPTSIYTKEALTPNANASAVATPRSGAAGASALTLDRSALETVAQDPIPARDPMPATVTMVELKHSRRILRYGEDPERPRRR